MVALSPFDRRAEARRRDKNSARSEGSSGLGKRQARNFRGLATVQIYALRLDMQRGCIANWLEFEANYQRKYITHIEMYVLSVDSLGLRKSLQAGNQGLAERITESLGCKIV